jgi:hypothetical protein
VQHGATQGKETPKYAAFATPCTPRNALLITRNEMMLGHSSIDLREPNSLTGGSMATLAHRDV